MPITRAKLLKYTPYLAVAGGFIAGLLTMTPLAAQTRAGQDAPPLQMVQATPLPRIAPSSQGQMQLSFAPVVARAEPAVVNVYAQRVVRGLYQDPFFGRFGGGIPVERVQHSLGSGVIVRPDGIIVTNNHVIEGAQSLKVVLADRREFDAEIVLADPRVDLAVLRIRVGPEHLPTLAFADTRQTQVGDIVLAIGNPFGLSETVTSGIVSALARTEVGISDYSFFIQTDASINPGNSGGALVDMNGALVGVNSAIFSQSNGGSNGIGFAIPSEMVRRVVESAVGGAHSVVRPWLGAQVQTVTTDLAHSMGLPRPEGVLIGRIYPSSAAARAGLHVGDVILNVAGIEVHDEGGVRYQFATQRPGSQVAVEYMRGGQHHTVNVAAEAPPGAAAQPRDIAGQNPLSGARVSGITPASAVDAGVDPFASGVFVQAIDPNSIAAQAGFQPGDVISSVNGQPVTSASQLDAMLNGAKTWVIGIERNGQHGDMRFGA